MVSVNLLAHIFAQNLVDITVDQLKTLKSANEKNGTYSSI